MPTDWWFYVAIVAGGSLVFAAVLLGCACLMRTDAKKELE